MAIVWVGVVIFLVFLFVLFVPLVSGGGNDGNHADHNVVYVTPLPVEPPYPQPQYTQPARRAGCQGILILLFIAMLFFVGAVILWSVSIQAGGL